MLPRPSFIISTPSSAHHHYPQIQRRKLKQQTADGLSGGQPEPGRWAGLKGAEMVAAARTAAETPPDRRAALLPELLQLSRVQRGGRRVEEEEEERLFTFHPSHLLFY